MNNLHEKIFKNTTWHTCYVTFKKILNRKFYVYAVILNQHYLFSPLKHETNVMLQIIIHSCTKILLLTARRWLLTMHEQMVLCFIPIYCPFHRFLCICQDYSLHHLFLTTDTTPGLSTCTKDPDVGSLQQDISHAHGTLEMHKLHISRLLQLFTTLLWYIKLSQSLLRFNFLKSHSCGMKQVKHYLIHLLKITQGQSYTWGQAQLDCLKIM